MSAGSAEIIVSPLSVCGEYFDSSTDKNCLDSVCVCVCVEDNSVILCLFQGGFLETDLTAIWGDSSWRPLMKVKPILFPQISGPSTLPHSFNALMIQYSTKHKTHLTSHISLPSSFCFYLCLRFCFSFSFSPTVDVEIRSRCGNWREVRCVCVCRSRVWVVVVQHSMSGSVSDPCHCEKNFMFYFSISLLRSKQR